MSDDDDRHPILPNSAHADMFIDITQVRSDVVASASGSINLAALTAIEQIGTGGAFVTGTYAAGGSALAFGPASNTQVEGYSGITDPATFGARGDFDATSGSGDAVATTPGLGLAQLYVPVGYVSADPLSDTDTWSGTTIAALGLTDGTYTYTWGSGATADSLTLNIGPVSAVPEPGSIYLAAAGGAMLLFRRLRKLA
jgi:hypothetical protein